MPVPMKRTAKRFGKAAADPVSAKARREGSHGRAIVTPAPRRTARREMRGAECWVARGVDRGVDWDILVTFPGLGIGLHARIEYASVQELRARDPRQGHRDSGAAKNGSA